MLTRERSVNVLRIEDGYRMKGFRLLMGDWGLGVSGVSCTGDLNSLFFFSTQKINTVNAFYN